MDKRTHFLKIEIGGFPLGVWMAFIALFLLFTIAFTGQAISLINWDKAVDLGLQNERFTGNAVDRAYAKMDKGICITDMLWSLPIGILAVIGLLKRKFFGWTTAMMTLYFGVYFSLVFLFQRWDMYLGTAIFAICIFAIPSLLGMAGLWVNRNYFFQNQVTNSI